MFEARLVGALKLVKTTHQAAVVIPKELDALTIQYGHILNTRIKANASGRPGPNAPTGDYRRSWVVEVQRDGDSIVVINGTNKPQGRRLEFGFVGVDSLNRHYNQPPYRHAKPALDEVGPRYVDAAKRLIRAGIR